MLLGLPAENRLSGTCLCVPILIHVHFLFAGTVHMSTHIVYQLGANPNNMPNEAKNIVKGIFKTGSTPPNPYSNSMGGRKLHAITDQLYSHTVASSGGPSHSQFVKAANNPSSFSVSMPSGAQGLQASLFMGVSAVLSAFLLLA